MAQGVVRGDLGERAQPARVVGAVGQPEPLLPSDVKTISCSIEISDYTAAGVDEAVRDEVTRTVVTTLARVIGTRVTKTTAGIVRGIRRADTPDNRYAAIGALVAQGRSDALSASALTQGAGFAGSGRGSSVGGGAVVGGGWVGSRV